MNTTVKEILRSLSVTGNYRGHLYTVIACELIFDDETKLYNVTRDIYEEVAIICSCKVHNIERNIRTIIYRIWRKQRARLNEIAGHTLSEPPSVSEFLAIITSYARPKERKVMVIKK